MPDSPADRVRAERARADHSVRLAWAADCDRVGEIQVACWQACDALLPAGTGDVPADEVAAGWRHALTAPPTARHRVLVALERDRVVGFAATAPAEDPDAEPGRDGELVAFHIDPAATGRGHGSRLLAACADTLRADGFVRGSTWLLVGDDATRAFLTGAGWGPDGASRELGTEEGGAGTARQVRLHTLLEGGQ